ncbi:MAG TPA: amino acid adenylation domain-containing protein, partial [Archangium sp.]|nr:amino acid adenylation domain-containing protein [Archangium sp.]
MQVIHPPSPVPLPTVDLQGLLEEARQAEAKRLSGEEAMRPFDLARGPLLRGTLVRLGEEEHVLLFNMHHIVSDGWSMQVLVREVSALYGAFSRGGEPRLPELPVQYADFAVWQREWLSGEVLEAQIGFWKEQLGGVPPLLGIPTDQPRRAGQSPLAASHPFALSSELSQRLRELSRREGATLFMTLLAAWQALLGRYAAQEDVVVGTPIAGRTRQETEGLIGFFVNMLALRADLGGDPTWGELLGQVRETALGAYDHQELPFERLVTALGAARGPGQTPLFQVLFELYQEEGSLEAALAPFGARPLRLDNRAALFDLVLTVTERSGGFDILLRYSEDLYTRSTVERMRRHYLQLLTQALRAPETRVDALELLTDSERQSAHRASRRDWALDTCVHELVSAQALRTPHQAALASSAGVWSYADLEAHTNRAARRMVAQGVGPECLVAVLCHRSEALVRSVLSLHKAGGAYLPLDARLPPARLAQLLSESRAPFVLSLGDCAPLLQEVLELLPTLQQPLVLSLDGLDSESAEPLPSRATPDNLAYVIFTSGSTGTPKGVMVEHRSMLNHFLGLHEVLNFAPGEVNAQTASMGFDISLWQMLGMLPFGATTHVFEDDLVRDTPRLVAAMAQAGVTIAEMVPTLLQSILEDGDNPDLPALHRVRGMIIGGQALPPALCQMWFERYPQSTLINAYGPTECTDIVTVHPMRSAPSGAFTPIGLPKANMEVYVLDDALQPVAPGVLGELHVGGTGVARGYLLRPELSAERFVPHPFSPSPGARLYRTGDIVRLNSEGLLEFVTRSDFQVKVRGFRIELGEVEASLHALSQVRSAAVSVRERRPGDHFLVAWVVAALPGVTESALLSALERTLPSYMVPSRLVLLPALPLNTNGKVDYDALGALPLEAPGAQQGAAPAGPLEQRIAQLFCEALGLQSVSREDDYFDLGGHSLSAITLTARLRQLFDVELPLEFLFAHPTVAGLAHEVEKRQGAAPSLPAPTALPAGAPPLLSSTQEGLWFLQQLQPDSSAYHIPEAVELTGPLDVPALEASLRWLLERHAVLRMAVPAREGQPHPVLLPVPEQVLSLETQARAGWLDEEINRPFTPGGPLYRFRLLRREPQRHVLLLVFHHLLVDGLSVGLLVRELGEALAAFSQHKNPELTAPRLS